MTVRARVLGRARTHTHTHIYIHDSVTKKETRSFGTVCILNTFQKRNIVGPHYFLRFQLSFEPLFGDLINDVYTYEFISPHKLRASVQDILQSENDLTTTRNVMMVTMTIARL
jgi:hypothetical protein